MPFSRPTRDELVRRAVSDMEVELQNGASQIRRTFERSLCIVNAGLADSQHAHIAWGARQAIPDTAEDEIAVRWAQIHMGEDARKQATRAEFPVQFEGDASSPIPEGTRAARIDGVSFETIADLTIPATPPFIVEGTVRAIETGANGNTVPDTTLLLEADVPGILAEVLVLGDGAQPIGGGADIETVEALKARFLAHLQEPPAGGTEADYLRWALASATHVTRAWVLPLQFGPSTVGISFVQDVLDEDGFWESTTDPGSEQIEEVEDYIRDRAPVSVAAIHPDTELSGVRVYALTALPIAMTITVEPNNATIQQAVRRQLEDLVLRLGGPSRTITLSQIREAISIATGEDFHDLVAPVANVTTTATQRHTVGTLTFQSFPED